MNYGMYRSLDNGACLVVFAGAIGAEGFSLYDSLSEALRSLDPFQAWGGK